MSINKSVLKLFGSKIIGTVLSFLGLAILAREMGASALGVFFLFQSLLGLLSVPADMGLRGGIEKRVSEGRNRGEIITTGLLMKILLVTGVLLCVSRFKTEINSYIGADLIFLLLIGIILQELSRLTIHILNGDKRVGETAKLGVFKKIVWVGVGLILVVIFNRGPDQLIIAYILSDAIVLFIAITKINLEFVAPSLESAQRIYNYAKYDVVTSAGTRIYSWLDVAIIGFFLSQEFVGAYEIAWRVTGVTILLAQSIRTTIFPYISDLDSDGDYSKIESLVENSLFPALLTVIPSFFGILVLSEEILVLIFGSSYQIAWVVLIIFALQKVIQAANDIFGRALQALDFPRLVANSMIIGILLNLGLNLILVPVLGIEGAAGASLISTVFLVGIQFYYLSEKIQTRIQSRKIGWCILSATAMGSVTYVLKQMVPLDSILALFALIAVSACLYSLLLLVYTPIRNDCLKVIDEFSQDQSA